MKLAELELKEAIYNRLTTGANKISYNFYESPPPEENYPYGCFSTSIGIDDSQKSLPGQQITIVTDWWDSKGPVGGSDETVIDMMDKALQSITVTNSKTENPLTLTTFDVNYAGFVGADLISNISDAIRHGQLKLRFDVSEK
jgi:hypothetical protein